MVCLLGSLLVAGGCVLLDIPPAREPLEQRWMAWMLAGHYGRWEDGKEQTVPKYNFSWALKDEIVSHPASATLTKYGIELHESAHAEGAQWWMRGGLIGRIGAPPHVIELFGRETDRIHRTLFWQGFAYGRDVEYDFFLLLRPGDSAPARLIKAWHFPRESLALSGDPVDGDLLRRSTRQGPHIEGFLHPGKDEMRRHLVDGFLDFDPASGMATVSVSGLKRPFRERVDLSVDLAR